MKEGKQTEILKFIMSSDMDFYEEYLSKLSEKELQDFLDKNPEFLQES